MDLFRIKKRRAEREVERKLIEETRREHALAREERWAKWEAFVRRVQAVKPDECVVVKQEEMGCAVSDDVTYISFPTRQGPCQWHEWSVRVVDEEAPLINFSFDGRVIIVEDLPNLSYLRKKNLKKAMKNLTMQPSDR